MGDNHCDRAKKRNPEACSPEWREVTCECGKAFRRCDSHGGIHGALRSRSAHHGLGCSRTRQDRLVREGMAEP